MVVSSPTWPPDSVPSAMTPSAPARATSLARATTETTGKTLAPASFHMGMKEAGLPAPVVMKGTFSSAAIWAISLAWGCMSMMFTPKGLSVRVRHLRMFSRKVSALMPPAPMRPMAPALETAAANSPVAMLAMPP